MLHGLNYQGVLTIELFDTGSRLLVNELAPRVHNSAHYSQDALDEDQFTAHLKGILNATLKSPKPKTGGFAMVNLLGTSEKAPVWHGLNNGFVHWYGKTQNRPGRKMGHVNVVENTANAALKKALKLAKEFKL